MNLIQAIAEDCNLGILHYERVHGGDINDSYCLHTTAEKYFLKINNAVAFPQMFEQEARGLNTLKDNCSLFVPGVCKYGAVNGQQYLLLEWIEPGKPANNFWEAFGAGMALLHKQPQPYFGWTSDNYIGSLIQDNTQYNSWSTFYTNCRIMPLVKQLFDAGAFNKKDVLSAELFCSKLEQLFPSEPPALLHGDLWSGNFMTTENGTAAVFDPAAYYGHREMDIGMTRLFGGFDQRFYNTYNEVYPLKNNWQQRLDYTQLYPLLVHAVLFRAHYIQNVRSIIQNF